MTESAAPAQTKNAPLARMALLGFGGFGAAVFVAVLIASIRKEPGIGGVLSGVFTGLFAGLLVAGAGAWIAMKLVSPRAEPPPIDRATADVLQQSLARPLAELEAIREEIVRRVNARAMWRVPLCAALALALWVRGLYSEDDPSTLFDLFMFVPMGAFGGYVWATGMFGQQYARQYKDRVLPALAARFGEITYRHAVMPDMHRLKAERVFRNYNVAKADDELFGKHRGLDVRIIELELALSGKNRRVVFDGLLVEICLPKRLSGTTAVIADGGAFGNLGDRMRDNGRQRVRLEDPVFEKVYEVYGSDQVEARALLNPAFMERMLKLGERPDFGTPLALAQDNVLLIALPKKTGRNLFEPPSFRKPAASREALLSLHDDIKAVLDAADAVIGLDDPGRARGDIT